MNFPSVIRAMNLSADGKGYAGVVEEVTPPKLTLKTEEFRAGGMDAPVELDMGMEKLELSFTVASYDPALFSHLGLVPGNAVNFTLRAAVNIDGVTQKVAIPCLGSFKEIDMNNVKSGEKAQLKLTVSLKKYELRIDGEEIIYIDVENMIRRIGGEDKLEAARAAIGL